MFIGLLLLFSQLANAQCFTSFCPKVNDLVVAYGTHQLQDGGWKSNGAGGSASKSAFNLLGGSVEFDMDVSKANLGVNSNIYLVFPQNISSVDGFDRVKNYCDGSVTTAGDRFCYELDIIESNGGCCAATTVHTAPGASSQYCSEWGCQTVFNYNAKTNFKMKVSFNTEGVMTVSRDGVSIPTSAYKPQPKSSDWAMIKRAFETNGAILYSSSWVGWVPTTSQCPSPSNPDLQSSRYSISNLRITGSVKQGPFPSLCCCV